jgi:CheY-like chemotaxis protein
MILSRDDFSITDDIDSWVILVVDDDEDVINVTHFVLEDLEIGGKPLEFINAHSAEEAAQILSSRTGIAVVLLDVVMESDESGLKLVQTIRDQLHNQNIRILLRTGQPGYAPEEEVVAKYDIDDYLSKSDLSQSKLITAVTSALRSYAHMMTLHQQQLSIKKELSSQQEELSQLNSLIEVDEPSQNLPNLSLLLTTQTMLLRLSQASLTIGGDLKNTSIEALSHPLRAQLPYLLVLLLEIQNHTLLSSTTLHIDIQPNLLTMTLSLNCEERELYSHSVINELVSYLSRIDSISFNVLLDTQMQLTLSMSGE